LCPNVNTRLWYTLFACDTGGGVLSFKSLVEMICIPSAVNIPDGLGNTRLNTSLAIKSAVNPLLLPSVHVCISTVTVVSVSLLFIVEASVLVIDRMMI
jgi:hypothetical protein